MLIRPGLLICLVALLLTAPAASQTTKPASLPSRPTGITERADRLPASVAKPAVVINDPAAASANVAAINAWLQKQREPFKYEYGMLVLPKGWLYIDDEIVVPPKTGIVITGAGSGIGYQQGKNAFAAGASGGPETQLVWVGPAGKAMIRLQGFGTSISGIKFQGRELPTHERSGTATRATYGILVEGRSGTGANPPTGKHHIRDCTFVEVETCFYCPGDQLAEDHGDTMRYGVIQTQSCDRLLHVRNAQSLSHIFYADVEFVGGTGPVFWFERGGHLVVNNLCMNTPGKLLKLGAEGHDVREFSPGANYFSINARWDNVPYEATHTLVDFTDAPDLAFTVRITGLFVPLSAKYDRSKLFLWGPTDVHQRRNIRLDLVNLPEEYAANFPMGQPMGVSNATRDMIPKVYEGLMVYNYETHRLQVYTGTAWKNLN